jgi:hypothetical protein
MIADRIAALDTSLFAHVESQTSDNDRKSLLAVHDAVATRTGEFTYLEIGSHLGGTLQTVLADPRCTRVISVDPRPQWQPDDRLEAGSGYVDNSTERMLGLLRTVPDADLSKLETLEESTENIAPGRFARPEFCFIDGEHTYGAALRDARFCRTVMQGAGIVAFHDFAAIERAVLDFLRETPGSHRGYSLWSSVFVVELGVVPTLLVHPGVRGQLHRPRRGWIAANRVGCDTQMVAFDIARRRLWHRV